MNYLPDNDDSEWPGVDRLVGGLPQLTSEERAALEEMPDDAVSHWRRGEKWDFNKKEWVPTDS